MFVAQSELILASGSPRRQIFLKELGLFFTITCPDGVEPQPEIGEQPENYACRAAKAKAHAAALEHSGSAEKVILAADTVVALGKKILGKPKDAADALKMLCFLSGKTHRVISAVSLIMPDSEVIDFYDVTEVRFHPWPKNILKAYVDTHEPMDKAGAYAIQGQGAFLVASIKGSWSTVVGLPMTQLVEILLNKKVIVAYSS